MSIIQHHKVVASLPSTLEADSVYYVRVGSGVDAYVTNGAGVTAAYPLRPSSLWAKDMYLAGCVPGLKSAAVANAALIQQVLDSGDALYFPGGMGKYYVSFAALNLPASARFYGDGDGLSQISWVDENTAVRNNMFEAVGDIDRLVVIGLDFYGNRPYQVSPTVNGHDLACFHLRSGSVANVHFDKSRFFDFGDGDSSGGGILIGALSGTNRVLRNILIENCDFTGISNVPGVYINGSSPYHSEMSDILVRENAFTATVSAHQNSLYVLGGSSATGVGVQLKSNRFHVKATIDTCIEVNYVTDYAIEGNQIICYNDASCVGVLVREGALYGSISHNTLVNLGTGNKNTFGISVQRLSSANQVGTIVDHNLVIGWGCGGNGGGIILGAGTVAATLTGNQIQGFGPTPELRTASAIWIANAARVRVSGNYLQNANYALVLGTINSGTVEDNTMLNVGDGAVGVIVETVPNQAMLNLLIRNNHVFQATAGTPAFVSVGPAATTGNRIENNTLPAGLQVVNPAFRLKWSAVVTPAATGALLAGRVYTFEQGALSIPNGDGFTIGGNLDATLDGLSASEVVPGDTVLIAPPGDAKGAVLSGYISTTNRVRIRVQNNTGAGIEVDAGTWRVTAIKTSTM